LVAGRRVLQIIRNVLLVFTALFAIFMVVVLPWFGANIVTTFNFHFPDPNDGKTPKSYGLDFQWTQFESSDGIRLSGWYIPAQPKARGTIIYCHGKNRSRIEMLPMAVLGHQLGYDGVLFDFRHSGMSGGKITTLGYQERLDAEAAVRYALKSEHAPHPIILWGVSMGAAAALMAAAETPAVDAVISDSTFLSFRQVIVHHVHLFFHLPSFPIADEVIWWSAWRGHFRPSEFDLRKAVRRINPRPVLFVAVRHDQRMPPWIAQELYSLSASPKKAIVVVPGSRHGEGFNSGREAYQAAVEKFLASLSP
jgi:fermentation-respiration switch protein FrsA (DUF1100 family)